MKHSQVSQLEVAKVATNYVDTICMNFKDTRIDHGTFFFLTSLTLLGRTEHPPRLGFIK